MKHNLYTIFDRVAGCNAIMTLPNDALAVRTFKEVLFDKKKDQHGNIILNQFQKSPDDFVLVKLGTIETETGEIEPCYTEILEAQEVVKNYELSQN